MKSEEEGEQRAYVAEREREFRGPFENWREFD